jgi:Helix-turn-helix domain
MASSHFWRERAAEFQLVPDYGTLRADGQYTVGSGTAWSWRLTGGTANDFIRSTFETLARRAAFEFAGAAATDLLVAWLEAIRKEGIYFRSQQIATEVREDGSKGSQYVLGTIEHVCKASVILCRKLESDALQAEFEEKQRNDPRNWSQFRQHYEAFKSIKEVRNEPAERIPEEFVRNAIARIHGIKPEEVTMKQIRLEVSGLLPFYRHIELVPSVPEPEPPSVPDTKPSDQADPNPAPSPPPEETIAAQLQRLREECRWTIPKLAEAAGIDPSTVSRHLSGRFIPYARNISAYERIFSKKLKRQVVMNKMP